MESKKQDWKEGDRLSAESIVEALATGGIEMHSSTIKISALCFNCGKEQWIWDMLCEKCLEELDR